MADSGVSQGHLCQECLGFTPLAWLHFRRTSAGAYLDNVGKQWSLNALRDVDTEVQEPDHSCITSTISARVGSRYEPGSEVLEVPGCS